MKYFLIILLSAHFCVNAFAKTLRVGKNQLYKSISSAIESSVIGDTVLVDAGLYFEKNLVINKRIVLKGIDHPIIDGEKSMRSFL